MCPRLFRTLLLAATALLPSTALLAQTTPKLVFSAPKAVNVPAAYTNVVASGDINGDGKTDLLTTRGLLLGDGQGGFTVSSIDESAVVAPSGYALQPVSLSLLDLNGDGKLDVIQAIPGQYDPNHCDDTDGIINVFIGDGHGHFTKNSTAISLNPAVAFSLVTGDFNHDGKADFAVAIDDSTDNCDGAGPSWISVYLNNGNGTFAQGQIIRVVADSLVTGDFNGDGHLDLAFYGGPYNVISVYSGNGDGSFRVGPKYTVDSQPFGLAAADLNGDKKADLVTYLNPSSKSGGPTKPRVAALLAKQSGGFYWAWSATLPDYPTQVASFFGVNPPIADFNGDGKLDLLLPFYIGGTQSSVVAFAGEGNGKFAAPQSFHAGPNLQFAFPLALTKGGRPDILFESLQNTVYKLGLLISGK